MNRRCVPLLVLLGVLVVSGCARNGQIIRSEAPENPDQARPARVNNAESRTVQNWDGGTN